MTANIARNKDQDMFATFRQDAWHKLGITFQDERNASEALAMLPQFGVKKLPTYYQYNDLFIPTNLYGIARLDENDKPIKTFGTVADSYTLVTPTEFCGAWDIAGHNWPIETIGFLGNGDTMFLLSKLGTREIAGDEVIQYILGCSYMDGKHGNVLKVTNTRVVCQNTLDSALALDSASNFKVDHDSDVISKMIEWIADVLATARDKAEAVAQAMELMSKRELVEEEVDTALKVAVRIPNQPRQTGSPLYDGKQLERWERDRDIALARQDVIKGLYEGEMTGYEAMTHGTAWGMLNAVAEAVQHVIPSRGDDDRAKSSADGWRMVANQRAFQYLFNISRN